jgi:hypothetical protein
MLGRVAGHAHASALNHEAAIRRRDVDEPRANRRDVDEPRANRLAGDAAPLINAGGRLLSCGTWSTAKIAT